MKVTDDLIDKLAKLNKLEFDADEKARIKTDLERMLDFVEQLNSLDTNGVEPLIHISDEVNVLRPDVVTESLTQAQALQNAPHHDAFYFKVPKVVENPDK
jgi:aspartyl-tRNA(Asn)/glutamyl-tRNA(Gln) amidotransferase subunit C